MPIPAGRVPAPVSGQAFLQSFAPILAQRLRAADALSEEQTLDAIDMPHSFRNQHYAFPADASPIFVLCALTIAHTRGSPRLNASSARTSA
ncbi:hypothetical protein EMEDMD4_910037 [Sinorhizobium medicae]|uniref:Uncharacterized protein n=1 Tax=Sinorhizobium medicae TaxID=110321 RepID=A0A508X7Z4_9HYPH|nr:hypothetical protein EMEDMD4_910037 [Sinorhizobium medicae]